MLAAKLSLFVATIVDFDAITTKNFRRECLSQFPEVLHQTKCFKKLLIHRAQLDRVFYQVIKPKHENNACKSKDCIVQLLGIPGSARGIAPQ
jgi:hypothetical protein